MSVTYDFTQADGTVKFRFQTEVGGQTATIRARHERHSDRRDWDPLMAVRIDTSSERRL